VSLQVSAVEKAGSKTSKAEARVDAIVGEAFDVQKFVENFEVLVAEVGGTRHLKGLVLELAIRGRMSTQRGADESAAVLLARLRSERLAARGSNSKATAPLEPPFSVPPSWAWARLDHLWRSITDGDHQPPPKSERGIPFLTIGNLSRRKLDFTSTRYVPDTYFDSLDELRVPRQGDLLYTVVGSYGIPLVVDTEQPFCVQRHVAILKPLPSTDVAFLRRLMESDFVYQQAQGAATGIAQPTVGLGMLRNFVVPVPPLEEQKRIVARVDQLMARIDDLEARQTKKREVSARFTKASLETLTTAEGPEEFDAAWKRVVENWDTILDEAEKATDLRKAVIEMAVRGHLVPGRPDDGQAPGFVAADEAPYLLPRGWRWGRLETLASHIVDCLHATPRYTSSGLPAIRTADVVPGRMLLDQARTIDEDQFRERIQRLEPKCGDIFYSREGERLGIAACVPAGVRVCLSQRMMQIRPKEPLFSPYIMWAMNSRFVYSQAVHDTGGSTSPHINMKDIRRFLLPVPPVAQQKRIVAKVEHLMKLCDDLEAKMRRAEDRASRLVEAVVREMVA